MWGSQKPAIEKPKEYMTWKITYILGNELRQDVIKNVADWSRYENCLIFEDKDQNVLAIYSLNNILKAE